MLPPHQLARLVEFGEARAYADMFRHAPPELHLRVEQLGAAIALIAPDLPILLFNRLIGLGLDDPATPATVDAAVGLYRAAGVKNFGVQLSPAAQPAELPDWLQARGLAPTSRWAKVYRAAEPDAAATTTLRIEHIGQSQAAAFGSVACAAFGLPHFLQPWLAAGVGGPGWHHYLAYEGDQPVATGALYVNGEVGWLGIGSTLPTHRRRGGQAALLAHRVQQAARLGCHWLITETGEDTPAQSNPSFRNMLRTGFLLAYQRPNYMVG